jgi:hypothetical protein
MTRQGFFLGFRGTVHTDCGAVGTWGHCLVSLVFSWTGRKSAGGSKPLLKKEHLSFPPTPKSRWFIHLSIWLFAFLKKFQSSVKGASPSINSFYEAKEGASSRDTLPFYDIASPFVCLIALPSAVPQSWASSLSFSTAYVSVA